MLPLRNVRNGKPVSDGLDEVVAHGDGRRLGAVGGAELVEDAGHVGLGRTASHEEGIRHLAVGATGDQQPQDLMLTRRQPEGEG